MRNAIASVVLLLLALLSGRAIAQSGEIVLYSGDEPRRIMGSMLLVDSANYDLTSAQARRTLSARFSTLPKVAPPRFAMIESRQWLLATLVNASEQNVTYILDTDEPVRYGVEVWLQRARSDLLIFETTRPPKTLSDRLVPERLLRSVPIELEPKERAYLWVHHDAQFSAKESFDLLTPATLGKRREARSLRFGLLAGGQAALVVLFAVFAVLLRYWPAFFYSAMFAALLVSDFQFEGLLFATLHPNAPAWYAILNPLVSIAVMFAFMCFVYSILPIRRYQWAMHFLALLCLGVIVMAVQQLFGETINVTRVSLYVPVVIAVSVFLAACIVQAIRERTPDAYLLVVAILLYISRYLLRGLAELAVIDVPNQVVRQILPVIQLADGLLFGAVVVRRALSLRRERDEERQRAEESRQRLAVASHDLRQPLSSLRVSLEEVQAVAPEAGRAIQASVDYLDGILDSSLQTTSAAWRGTQQNTSGPETVEEVAVQTLFDNVQRMFASEAEAGGVDLRCVPTSVVVMTEPVALIRMLSNLVSNAVKYTGNGRVLVGVRRRADSYCIEVWDNGDGLTEAELDRVLKPYERGSGRQGEGLGLDIVAQLADASGLSFRVQSWTSRGSVFRIGALQSAARRSP